MVMARVILIGPDRNLYRRHLAGTVFVLLFVLYFCSQWSILRFCNRIAATMRLMVMWMIWIGAYHNLSHRRLATSQVFRFLLERELIFPAVVCTSFIIDSI